MLQHYQLQECCKFPKYIITKIKTISNILFYSNVNTFSSDMPISTVYLLICYIKYLSSSKCPFNLVEIFTHCQTFFSEIMALTINEQAFIKQSTEGLRRSGANTRERNVCVVHRFNWQYCSANKSIFIG